MFCYVKKGNLKYLKRHRLLGKYSTFGIIDELRLGYKGNQLVSIINNVSDEPLYSGAFNFLKKEYINVDEYKYDANGNLMLDSIKGITKIQYNSLSLPDTLLFRNGNQLINRYAADRPNCVLITLLY